jgi:hypothetical protein
MSEQHPEFAWRGLQFGWSYHRAAYKGNILLSGKTYWLLARDAGTGNWESWCEWQGGYTAPCTMADAATALDGAVLALQDFLQTSLKDLEPYAP